ncbi:MAG: transposase family protein [Pyrinomonadaceae bacterium]
MEVSTLLADPHAIRLETIRSSEKSLTLVVRAVRRGSECPRCSRVATRVHSRYVRRVADLPWHGVAVHLAVLQKMF